MTKRLSEIATEEVMPSEACLVGLFWNDPKLYGLYGEDKLERKAFSNPIWGFFFGLGGELYKRKLNAFDDISTIKTVNELGIQDMFEHYGGYGTIKEIMEENADSQDNLEGYYDTVKKYYLLKRLSALYGEQVYRKMGKYDYRRISRNLINMYWKDKLNKVLMEEDNSFDEGYLLENLEEAIVQWRENPTTGLPFYQSRLMSEICVGWDYGHVYMHAGFGGKGKTSLTMNKIVMSCIEHGEKLLIIANEEGMDAWQKLLLTTVMGAATKQSIKRQLLLTGEWGDSEHQKLAAAVKWLKQKIENEKSIVLVFMESYTMDNVKKVLTHYAHRGYRRVVVDTAKPGDDATSQARWERFTDDMKDLYKLARPDAGGLNLAVWVNVQAADTAVRLRFLNEYALGDSKKIKNEASVLFLTRPIRDDEYEEGSNELKVYTWEKHPITDEWIQVVKTLERVTKDENGNVKYKNIYYLLFTAKNRRGQSNDTGLDVLVMAVNLNNNTWREVGWTTIANDNKY